MSVDAVLNSENELCKFALVEYLIELEKRIERLEKQLSELRGSVRRIY